MKMSMDWKRLTDEKGRLTGETELTTRFLDCGHTVTTKAEYKDTSDTSFTVGPILNSCPICDEKAEKEMKKISNALALMNKWREEDR